MINYYLITKPGIIFGNLLTVAAGFLLASHGNMHWRLFFCTLLGMALIMASACIFNNYIDRNLDRKMKRTKDRALASGAISATTALSLASLLLAFGVIVLALATNLVAVIVALIGFVVYVLLYSIWKSRTVYGTAIGSVAGAVPPVVGYCAVSGTVDLGATILFAMLVLWQMPHFFAIATYHIEDYRAAGIPVLPLEKGLLRTKIHSAAYIIAFIACAALLTAFGYTGWLYLAITTGLALFWLAICVSGFTTGDDIVWGKRMFRWSLVLITAMCVLIPLDTK